MATYNRHSLQHQVIINPQGMYGNHLDESPDLNNVRVTGTYLHGELQEKAGFDIFSFASTVPTYTGIYPTRVLTLSENATLFLWRDNNGLPHGLVVDNDDKEALAYATECYNQRKHYL